MRISDWSSDVCSSDLRDPRGDAGARQSGLVTISHGERARVREISARAAIHQVDMVAQLMLSTLPDALEHLKETRTFRSEERRVGKECVRTCSTRWSPYH